MSLWHKLWDFLDGLSDQAVIVFCLLLIAWYAVRTHTPPDIAGSSFASARRHYSIEMIRDLPRLSLCPLRLLK